MAGPQQSAEIGQQPTLRKTPAPSAGRVDNNPGLLRICPRKPANGVRHVVSVRGRPGDGSYEGRAHPSDSYVRYPPTRPAAVRCCNRREFYSPVREMHLRAILVADQTPPSTLMVSPLTKD